MGLESGTYLTDLNSSNPTGTDLKSQGDDHLRLIKSVLLATFPNASRAFRITNTVSAQTSAYSPAANICDNLVIPVNSNAGAVTVTLPATPGVDGMKVYVIKTDSSANLATISGNGNNINSTPTHVLNGQYSSVMLIWCAAITKWLAVGGSSQGPLVGELKAWTGTAVPGGWLRCNAQTIGSATSGATRANADTEALFRHCWDSFSNTVCPVSSGRGASAAADFAANKTLTLPDLRGRSLFGLDDMGASAAGRLAGATIDQTTNGANGGTDTVTLTRANLPNVTVNPTVSISDPTHAHTYQLPNNRVGENGTGGFSDDSDTPTATSSNATGITATSSFALNGGVTQTVVDKLPPCFLVTWLIKM
jgi:microcystin-dependent protein